MHNPILQCYLDISNFSSALPYFEGYVNNKKNLLNLTVPAPARQIEGEIKSVSSNYLLTQKDQTIIIYHLSPGLK